MADLVACVEIVHWETKIGDSLCTLPLILQMADICATTVHVTGAFAEPVKGLLQGLPICFGAPDQPASLSVRADVPAAYDQGRKQDEHMAEAFCRLAGWPLPALPMTLDLTVSPLGLAPGIALSPFSGSANSWYKLWPMERWAALVRHLVVHQSMPVYVLAATTEDVTGLVGAGATPLVGLPLPEVLDVIRSATLFVSMDNGLSHLAHFGGVERHLLIYPALLPPRLVVNPRARVLRGQPEQLDVALMIHHVDDMLTRAAMDGVGSAMSA